MYAYPLVKPKYSQDAYPILSSPYARDFWEMRHLYRGYEAIVADILTLLDHEGNIPSIVIPKNLKNGNGEYKMAEKVSLLNHSINVARNVMVREGSLTWSKDLFLGLAVVAALGHDLGKIGRYRDYIYCKYDHPNASANVLHFLIDSRLSATKEKVIIHAVRYHHDRKGSLTSQLGEYLPDSDSKARADERMPGSDLGVIDAPARDNRQSFHFVSGPHPEHVSAPWFDLGEYLAVIERMINNPFNNTWHPAFTLSGVVCVSVGATIDAFRALAASRQILALDTPSNIAGFVGLKLKEAGVLDERICEPFGFSQYKLSYLRVIRRETVEMFLIKNSTFSTPYTELDTWKAGTKYQRLCNAFAINGGMYV